ncbi:MAG TPA: GNAT family N-acetyltransferase [Thermoplasmata archaeon]|nr:GNAT family N-acetyltransferase [Thermoplasmata archaeon]
MGPRASPKGVPSRALSIRSVRTRADLEAARRLLREYRQFLAEDREVTNFDDSILKVGLGWLDEEIEELPGAYGPPGGSLLLAFSGRAAVGCGAIRRVRKNVAEIKRVYVRSDYRGAGIGRRLTQALLDRAERLGYQRAVLDTLPTLTAAIDLYRRMGFVRIPAYWAHPVPDALFFEYRFRKTAKGTDRTG